MSSQDILENFLILEKEVEQNTTQLTAVNSVTDSGALLVGDGTGPSVLDPSTGLDGQILKRDTGSSQGISWAANVGLGPSGVTPDTYLNGTFTVDANGIVTAAQQGSINNVTPTTTKGDLLVENGLEVVRFGVGANGSFLSANSVTSTGLDWITFSDIVPTTTKGDLLTEDISGPTRLPVGTDGQMLCANSAQATGLEWVDKPATPTLEDLTPTTTKGQLIVHDNTGTMVPVPIPALPANDGHVLTLNSTVGNICMEWAAPSGGGGGSGPYNVIENVHSGAPVTVNITLGTYPHNTIFMINPNGNSDTNFTYNLPPITVAEQGVVYRICVYQGDSGFSPNWQIIPDGFDLIEFVGVVDDAATRTNFYQCSNGDPAAFNIAANLSDDGSYGAGITLMAFKPASGTAKWIGVGVARGVQGPGGGLS